MQVIGIKFSPVLGCEYLLCLLPSFIVNGCHKIGTAASVMCFCKFSAARVSEESFGAWIV